MSYDDEDLEERVEKLEEEIKSKLSWWELILGLFGFLIGAKIINWIFN